MTTSSTTSPAATNTQRKAELLQRARSFAKEARSFVGKTPRSIINLGDCRQLVKASGAIGTCYIEADTAPGRTEFIRSIQSCRRFARQSNHYLQLLDVNLEERSEEMRSKLEAEAHELERIFGAIVGSVLNKAKADKADKDLEG